MAAEREIGVDALLERDGAELLEARDLGLGERLVEEVRERGAAPERERLAERALGRGRISCLERRPSVLREPREAVEVDALGIELEHVARRAGRDHGPERLAELRDVDLDRVRRGLGRIAGPERLDEPVDGDDAARLEREHGEQRARLRPAERDGRAVPLAPRSGRGGVPRALGCLPRSLRPFVVPRVLCAVALSHGFAADCHTALSRS